jgi:RNA-directed DNA polymerase
MPQERMSAWVASIRAGFGQHAIGLGYLGVRLLGHFGYFGITGNARALHNFRHCVIDVIGIWRKCRSLRAWISWEGMLRVFVRYPLPQPGIRPSAIT